MNVETDLDLERHPYVDAFVDSAGDALRTMAALEVHCRTVCLAGPGRPAAAELYAEMAVRVGSRPGYLGLAMGRDLALRVIAGILGRQPAELTTEEGQGGVEEILNVIAGNAKARLVDTPFHFELQAPRLAPFDAARHARSQAVVVVFELEYQTFDLVIRLEPGAAA